MAHRLPPAGIVTTPTEVFRFYQVRECPEKSMATNRCLGSRQQTCPVLKCCCRKVKPPGCCDVAKPTQKCAHLLPPAGMASRKSDVFRFNMVHESEGKRGSKAEACSCCCKCCKCCKCCVPAQPRPKPPPAKETVCCCEVTCRCPLKICCECRKVKRPECRPRPPQPEPVMLCCTKLRADDSPSEISSSRSPPQEILVCCSDDQQDEPPPEDEQQRSSLHCPSDVFNLEEELPLPPTKNNWPAQVQTPTVADHRRRLGPETSWLENQLKSAHYPRLSRILYPPSKDKNPATDRSRTFAATPSKLLR